jgi:site-specific DNA recombinase
VIGEPHRAFYGNQFGLTFPLFTHYGVQLWVPEVGGPLDADNEAHDLVMSVFGGMSKGERNRIKVRVRTAMAAQAHEGRFLGGRPPYGYRLIHLGPHPNPAKAADGRQLHGLALDEATAPVVMRIFTEFLTGAGIYAIAEDLTRDGVPCPSAYDRARNPHRKGAAWAKTAVRAILANPRYTGRQVWNRQRTDEVLLDVEDVAMGHTSVTRWNPQKDWVVSRDVVHPVIIDPETFDEVQHVLQQRARKTGVEHRRMRTHHLYYFRGQLRCGLCDRKMQGQRSNGEAYYRCRYAQEYALANTVDHPRNVYLRERELLSALDAALAWALAPDRRADTIAAMAEHQAELATHHHLIQARAQLATCDTKLARHRAALEAGADPTIVAGWLAEVEQDRQHWLAVLDRPGPEAAPSMSRDEIADLVEELGGLVAVLPEADPADRSAIYQQLGLRLVYHPQEHSVRIQAQPESTAYGKTVCVRGGT